MEVVKVDKALSHGDKPTAKTCWDKQQSFWLVINSYSQQREGFGS